VGTRASTTRALSARRATIGDRVSLRPLESNSANFGARVTAGLAPYLSARPAFVQKRCEALAGGVSQEHTGDDGERCGVRAWRQGDTLRGVHWALTARHNRLIVCERQGAAQSRTAVRVDTSPAAHVGVGPSSTLEWSLRIAASVCELLLSQGVVVSLELGGTPATFAPGAASVRKMLDLIAECEAATQAASPAGPRSRREDDAGFLIDIGTDRRLFALTTSGRRNVRRIVLGTAAFHARPEPAPLLELRTSVIVIDDAQQPLEQLANRWRQNGGVLCGT